MVLPHVLMVFSRIYQAWINMSILCIPMLVLGVGSERECRLLLKRESAQNPRNLTLLPHSKWGSLCPSLEVAYKPGICSAHFFSFKVSLACFKWSPAIGEGQPFKEIILNIFVAVQKLINDPWNNKHRESVENRREVCWLLQMQPFW